MQFLRILLPIFIAILAGPSHADDEPCVRLLSVGRAPTTPLTSKLTAARAWRLSLINGDNPIGFDRYLREMGVSNSRALSERQRADWLDRYIVQQWSVWGISKPGWRSENLAFELMKIQPPREDDSSVISIDGATELSRLSQENKARFLARMRKTEGISPEFEAVVRDLVKKLDFAYLRNQSVNKKSGVEEPIATSRELRRLGMFAPRDFYSTLLQGAASVEFDAIAGYSDKEKNAFYNLGAQVSANKIRPTEAVTKEFGYVMPLLHGVGDLLLLFKISEPEALQDVLERMRFDLPNSVRTPNDLIAYAHSGRIDSLFPPQRQFLILSALRTRLGRFVLREPDAQEVLREAFVQFIFERTRGNWKDLDDLRADFVKPGGAQSMFATSFRDYMQGFYGWSGFTLHIPGAVPPKDYLVIKTEATPQNRPEYLRPGVTDRKRIDRDGAP
jgi:hypothetical protein